MLPRTEALDELFQHAQEAALHAYAPYSGFRVGAALLLADGSIVTGCNVENAAYGSTICAERAALVRAVSERGPGFRIAAIAVANRNQAASAPCGACRQMLAEFAAEDAWVVFPGEGGSAHAPVAFSQLFPFTFQLAARA